MCSSSEDTNYGFRGSDDRLLWSTGESSETFVATYRTMMWEEQSSKTRYWRKNKGKDRIGGKLRKKM